MILPLQLAANSWSKSMNLDNNVKSLEHRRNVKSIVTVLESDCAFLFKLAKESLLLFQNRAQFLSRIVPISAVGPDCGVLLNDMDIYVKM